MAQKLPLLKLLQEIRGYAEAGNRSTTTRFPLAAVTDLRSTHRNASLPHRRFFIPVRHEHHAEECVIPIRQAPLAEVAPTQVIKSSAA